MKEQLIAFLKACGFDITGKDKEIDAAIANVKLPEAKAPDTPAAPVAKTETVAGAPDMAAFAAMIDSAVAKHVAPLATKIDAVEKYANDNVAVAKAQADAAQAASTKKLLDECVADGRIPNDKRADFEKDLQENPAVAAKYLAMLPPNPTLAKAQGTNQPSGTTIGKDGKIISTAVIARKTRLEREVDPKYLKYVQENTAEAMANGKVVDAGAAGAAATT